MSDPPQPEDVPLTVRPVAARERRFRWLVYGAMLGLSVGLAVGFSWAQARYERQIDDLVRLIETQGKWLRGETSRRIAAELQLAELTAREHNP